MYCTEADTPVRDRRGLTAPRGAGSAPRRAKARADSEATQRGCDFGAARVGPARLRNTLVAVCSPRAGGAAGGRRWRAAGRAGQRGGGGGTRGRGDKAVGALAAVWAWLETRRLTRRSGLRVWGPPRARRSSPSVPGGPESRSVATGSGTWRNGAGPGPLLSSSLSASCDVVNTLISFISPFRITSGCGYQCAWLVPNVLGSSVDDGVAPLDARGVDLVHWCGRLLSEAKSFQKSSEIQNLSPSRRCG